jgi:hypothetical protein
MGLAYISFSDGETTTGFLFLALGFVMIGMVIRHILKVKKERESL